MTDEERQLLKDTAENLLRLLRQWDDMVEGMRVVVSELCRAGAMTPERKALLLGRLKLRRDLMASKGTPTQYLSTLIDELEKWSASDSHPS
ncbi:MAG: hypothetical protein HY852_02105 [Bradyrhizobium sp.]|uniref:hypothetical protein n=1 Tax=Bradyrhizobium sp. TaxID=376 RepID=UPI0025B7F5F8|nr:hypothetical protein [Bradyrhizobium sp.]MBI5260594.1 hypothetical protein [Bradyrhizobium sp.]